MEWLQLDSFIKKNYVNDFKPIALDSKANDDVSLRRCCLLPWQTTSRILTHARTNTHTKVYTHTYTV